MDRKKYWINGGSKQIDKAGGYPPTRQCNEHTIETMTQQLPHSSTSPPLGGAYAQNAGYPNIQANTANLTQAGTFPAQTYPAP
ncbi:MAG: hypothetical protein JW862_01625 [Anaerolineales bacterium]|nr:hypothetical protein [Anaerolineales bacterium]